MFAGIGLALIATICFASGNVIEKRAVDKLPSFSLGNVRAAAVAVSRSGWWLAGAIISVIGLGVQILAYSHIAISIVQSVGVAGVVLLVALSRVSLHERLSRRELAGLGLAVASLVLVSLSLTPASDVAGLHGAVEPAIIVGICTLGVVAAMLATPFLRRDQTGFVYGCMAGVLYGLSGLGAKGISTLITEYGWPDFIPHVITSPFLYFFFGCWALALGVFQYGLQRCRVGVVGSLSSIVSSAFVVAVGMPVFGEHLPASEPLRLLRILGLMGILAGSALVGWGGNASPVVTAAPVVVEPTD
jgi:drug/metabolite transporter (DMT)-like permease